METRALLLIEACEKEVWDVPYSQNEKVWTDIRTILKSYPNYEVTFQNLNWRRCEEEYCRSVAAYAADRQGVPFRSGTAEQHEQWHNIMKEVFELKCDKEVALDIEPEQQQSDPKQVEKDMKAVGELIRSTALDKFRKRAVRPKAAGSSKKRSAKSAHSEVSGSETEEVKSPA